MKKLLLPLFLLVFVLAGCSQNRFDVLDLNDEANFPQDVFQALYVNPEEPGVFTARADVGTFYMAVSSGEAHKLDRHLRLTTDEYDSTSKTLTLTFEQFVPGTGETMISSWNWFPVVKFDQISATTVKVLIYDQDNVFVAQYEAKIE